MPLSLQAHLYLSAQQSSQQLAGARPALLSHLHAVQEQYNMAVLQLCTARQSRSTDDIARLQQLYAEMGKVQLALKLSGCQE